MSRRPGRRFRRRRVAGSSALGGLNANPDLLSIEK